MCLCMRACVFVCTVMWVSLYSRDVVLTGGFSGASYVFGSGAVV